jgi:hypothetical protein
VARAIELAVDQLSWLAAQLGLDLPALGSKASPF